jgi:glucose uptake protein GlcU
MFESVDRQRVIGRYAWVMAWFGLVAGQLHALARHNTVDGRNDLKLPLTRLWSDPARSALKPLLNWANPDTVYLTYGKIWLPVFLGFTLCALAVHARRRPSGFEKWAWRVALTGYVWASAGVFCDYWTQLRGYNGFFDTAFLITIPGLLLTLLGSTLLGIALLRRRLTPKLPAWLLTLMIPLAVGIDQVTSMGSMALPVMFAFGILGHQIAGERAYTQVIGATTVI